MAPSTDARAVRGVTQQGDGARLHRRLRVDEGAGRVQVRRLRGRAVQRQHEVRVRHRLAELLGADRPGGRGPARGPRPRHATHRGHVRAVRRAPGPRVPRRPAAHGRPLLHELGGTGAGPGREEVALSGAAAAGGCRPAVCPGGRASPCSRPPRPAGPPASARGRSGR